MSLTAPTVLPLRSSSEPPAILAPAADLFARRAARFEALAAGHALADWLRFLAVISRAQQAAMDALPAPTLPDSDALRRAAAHHMPPVPAQSWPRQTAWQDALRQIAGVAGAAAPAAARAAPERLAALPATALEALADQVLRTELYGAEAPLLPYVGAALQVWWTALARRLAPHLAPLDVPGVCPCCGFLPVTSIVQSAGDTANLRYLHCALCNTRWNLVRVKCAACDATEGVSYRELDGAGAPRPAAVRGETCDSCHSYLKIVYTEHGGIDPVADDLATLALDILLDEAGYARAGPNLLFVPGEPGPH